MRWLFFLYLLVNPYIMIENVSLRQGQEFFFQVSSILLIVLGLTLGKQEVKFNKLSLCGLSLVVLFFIVYLKYLMGWSILINLVLGYLVYLSALRSLKKEDIRFIFKAISIVAIASVVYLGAQYLLNWDIRGVDTIGVHGLTPKCSFFGLPAATGMYQSLALPILLSFSWWGLLMFAPLVFSWSTGAYAASVFATLFYAWFRKRWAFWVLLPLISIAFVLFIWKVDNPQGMYKTRPPMWRLVIEDIHKNPLIGHGLDSFRMGNIIYLKNSFDNISFRAFKGNDGTLMIPRDAEKEVKERIAAGKNPFDLWDNAHNTFIHYTYEAGVFFPVIVGYFFFVVISLFRRSKRSKETVALTAAIITFGISSLVQFPFNLARIVHVFPILVAMFYISVQDDVN